MKINLMRIILSDHFINTDLPNICMDIHRNLEIIFAINKLLNIVVVFGHLSIIALTQIPTHMHTLIGFADTGHNA